MEKKRYYTIHKYYLAMALSYLGFRFKVREDLEKGNGRNTYLFDNTEELKVALTGLKEIKEKISKKK